MWIVEEDMVVPDDALSKLMEIDADVVTGFYVLRHGDFKPNLHMWNPTAPGLMRAYRWHELKPPIMKVSGGCMGCLLLDRKVIEGFSFILRRKSAPDTEFMNYCHTRGFNQMARLDVECGHINAEGETLWPHNYMAN